MRQVLIAVLTRMGGQVIDCAGKQALAILNDPFKIDSALLDVLMPEMHGLCAAKYLCRSGLQHAGDAVGCDLRRGQRPIRGPAGPRRLSAEAD